MRLCPTCSELWPDGATVCPLDGARLAVPPDPMVGQIVAERYQVLSVLGRGGMATVYLARHVMTDRLSALKVLRDTSAPEAVRARFFREAHALGRIDHPHVVGITDFGEWSGLVFLVMDYVPGQPLSRTLGLPWQRVAHVGRQLAAALARIHQLGIVHRDVKPANVILTQRAEREHAMLTDFGIADVHGAAPLTLTSQLVGTPGYIAPECIQGADAEPASDLYSLGVTLYEALTGQLPFDERSTTPLLMQVLSSPPRPIDRRRVLLPEALAELVERLLAKHPRARPRDAFWVEAELVRLIGHDDRHEPTFDAAPPETVRAEPYVADTTTRPLAHFHPACAMALERVVEHATVGVTAKLDDARRRVDALGVSTHVIGVEQERLSLLESHARTLRSAIGAALDGLGRDASLARSRLEAATSRHATAVAGDWRADALVAEIACLGALTDDLGVERELLRSHLDTRSSALEARIGEARRGLEARVVALRADAAATWDALESIAKDLGLSGPLAARPASRRTPQLLPLHRFDRKAPSMQTMTTSRLARSALSLLVAVAIAGAPTTSLFAQKKPAPAAPAKDAKPDKAKQEKAREAFKRGQEKMAANDFAGAAEGYKEANDLIPSAQAQYKLALALDKAGKAADAFAAYQMFLGGTVPESMAESKAAAEKRVAELGTATLKVTTNPPGANVKIDGERSLDGSPMSATVKPGKHKIEVTMADHEPASREIEVAAGATAEVSLDLKAAPAAAPPPVASSAAPVASSAPAAPPPPPPAEPRSKVPAYVVLGVGGAAAVVGAVFGMQALSAKSKFNDAPTTERADKAEKNALVADMAFGVALTLGVTGAVLLLTSDKPAEPKAGKLHVAPVITPSAQGAAAYFKF